MANGNRATRLKFGVAAAAASGTLALAAAVAMTGPAGAATAGAAAKDAPQAAPTVSAGTDGYQFVTLGSNHDRTFNQLLGINNKGVIAGYDGSGMRPSGHPNKGYVMSPPYAQGDIASENYPNSKQTQVTGLNDQGATVGFFSSQFNASNSNNNFGWYKLPGGSFHQANYPTGTPNNPPTDQLLGINNHDVAVGFFVNASGQNRGYTYNINTHTFARVTVPGAAGLGPSLAANAINNHGDVAGAYTPGKVTEGFLKLANGDFIKLAVPGASATQALGVNDSDTVVGFYTVGSATHGFIWRLGSGFTSVDDPNGIGNTTLNGINNENDIVGFYTDTKGNVDGLIGYPAF